MNESIDFLNELRKLEGLECWGVVAGEGTGTRVSLDFGQKISRKGSSNNPLLSEVLRHYTGEFSVFIRECAWRLESDQTLCTWKSPNANDGEMIRCLQGLVGRCVTRVSVASPAFDLVIEFSGDLKLSLFCDCFDEKNDGSNYSFHNLNNIYVVRARSQLTRESKS